MVLSEFITTTRNPKARTKSRLDSLRSPVN